MHTHLQAKSVFLNEKKIAMKYLVSILIIFTVGSLLNILVKLGHLFRSKVSHLFGYSGFAFQS